MTRAASGTLILLRHGESIGNRDGIFTGILDVPLSSRGRREAVRAGTALVSAGLAADVVLTSTMRRAQQTVAVLRSGRPPYLQARVPVLTDARLNERNYGALTGRTRLEVREAVGEARLRQWRRSLVGAPPPMGSAQRSELLTRAAPGSADLGATESLLDVVSRVGRCYRDRVVPPLEAGRTVLVVAHGNSLRAMCVVLEDLTASAVAALNLPTGYPLVYRFDPAGRPVVPGGTYLDPEAASQAASFITRQGGT